MPDTKRPGQDNVSEDVWTLFKQLRIDNLVDAIKETTFSDFEHLTSIVKGRELNLETFTLLISEANKTRTGKAMRTTIGLAVCVVLFVYPMAIVSPFLATLGFTNAGPAAGKKLHLDLLYLDY
ncbi:unnamed protein product [Aureobasidium mustum]|uniref:Uncharacterized protein n=1 Tax=Aureobasidium mustum TaxID=2773714 RepID=A0A9N8PFP7_9PEZI|nr:unnamed protein product [Aureobasidium mustum]